MTLKIKEKEKQEQEKKASEHIPWQWAEEELLKLNYHLYTRNMKLKKTEEKEN